MYRIIQNSLLALLVGCSTPQSVKRGAILPTRHQIPNSEYADYRKIPELVVNNSSEHVNWTFATEEEGVRMMRGLMLTSAHEEAFFYFPEKNIWIEAGVNSSSMGALGEQSFIDIGRLITYLDAHPDVTRVCQYHFHPDHVRQSAEQHLLIEFSRSNQPYSTRLLPTTARLICQMPSAQDVYEAVIASCVLAGKNPAYSSTFNIVGFDGVLCMGMTQEGLEHFLILDGSAREQEATRYSSRVSDSILVYSVLASLQTPDAHAGLDAITEYLDEGRIRGEHEKFFRFAFVPYK